MSFPQSRLFPGHLLITVFQAEEIDDLDVSEVAEAILFVQFVPACSSAVPEGSIVLNHLQS